MLFSCILSLLLSLSLGEQTSLHRLNMWKSTNPSNILSKHWDMPSVWDSLKPLLFWWWTNADKPPHNGSKKDTVAMDSKMESAKTGSK